MNAPIHAARVFTVDDVEADALSGQRVAILGYGGLGRPLALNFRDSGVGVTIGNIADEYADRARTDGFVVSSPGDAVSKADIVLILLPDEVIPEVFDAEIAPRLAPGSAIAFGSGYTLAYELIKPPAHVDTLLLAPRMAGETARQRFVDQQGFFAYISVEQDASGKAWSRLLGLAHAAGVLQIGAMELSARQEADLDLFIEQSLGAVIGTAVLTAFAVGQEAGLPPETLVMEMYMSEEMENVFRAFRERGFFRSAQTHGPTALFGAYRRTLQLMQSELASQFADTLQEIQSGVFAQHFQAEREAGYPTLSQANAMLTEDNEIEQAESRIRELFQRSSTNEPDGSGRDKA
jgi:ketol-acid reductoisomerase